LRSYVPSTGMELLAVTPVSKAQAWQRAGRAGREAPGKVRAVVVVLVVVVCCAARHAMASADGSGCVVTQCFRLYQETVFEKLRDAPVPEVRRVSLASVVLRLKAMGVQKVHEFAFLEPPSTAAIARALERLVHLTALDVKYATCMVLSGWFGSLWRCVAAIVIVWLYRCGCDCGCGCDFSCGCSRGCGFTLAGCGCLPDMPLCYAQHRGAHAAGTGDGGVSAGAGVCLHGASVQRLRLQPRDHHPGRAALCRQLVLHATRGSRESSPCTAQVSVAWLACTPFFVCRLPLTRWWWWWWWVWGRGVQRVLRVTGTLRPRETT